MVRYLMQTPIVALPVIGAYSDDPSKNTGLFKNILFRTVFIHSSSLCMPENVPDRRCVTYLAFASTTIGNFLAVLSRILPIEYLNCLPSTKVTRAS